MSGRPAFRSRFRVFIRRSAALSQRFESVPGESRPTAPAGGPASCGLPPPSGSAGTSSASSDRKQKMITRRRGPRIAHGYAFPSGAAGLEARRLTPGAAVIVAEWERAVLCCRGRVERVLEPGLHRFWRFGCSIRTVDTRPWVISLPAQEVPTADGVPVKVTVAGQARVSDALAYVTATRFPEPFVYLAVQVAVRDLLAATTLEELLGGR